MKIGMTLKQASIIGAACAGRWRMVCEVLVNQAMRTRNDQRSAARAATSPNKACVLTPAGGESALK